MCELLRVTSVLNKFQVSANANALGTVKVPKAMGTSPMLQNCTRAIDPEPEPLPRQCGHRSAEPQERGRRGRRVTVRSLPRIGIHCLHTGRMKSETRNTCASRKLRNRFDIPMRVPYSDCISNTTDPKRSSTFCVLGINKQKHGS